MNRREFIQSAAVATAAFSLPSFSFIEPRKKLGLQLYSLRDIIGKDTEAVLKQVAGFGYKELEVFGYNNGKLFGKPVADVYKMTNDLGMKLTSGHYGTDLFGKWEQVVADAKNLGHEYVVVPWMPKEKYDTLDRLKNTCEEINKNAELCQRYGMRMGYHNHAFEFEPIENQIPYQIMLKELDPKLVSMEMDIYWVVFAHHDPLKLIAEHPGRFEQWHVKDMRKEDRKLNADVGTGTIDFKTIFTKANEAGLKHFYIEQETYPISSIESVKACATNVKELLSL
ncbi:MAG: sugar phosphate isomerase/epimerase [Bacteroidetes bacterium]|nr:sugar phosphate isomerase/epimerase [Bacteroidota bacterium]